MSPVLKPTFSGLSDTEWPPRLDIHETPTAMTIKAELPWATPDDLDVEIDNNMLLVRGRKTEEKDESHRYVHTIKAYCEFCHKMLLPASVSAHDTAANFRSGVLTITMPKRGAIPVEALHTRGESSLPVRASDCGLVVPSDSRSRSGVELELDINYQAFLKDSKELETQFPGHLVAYADGIRVAVGKDARDLLSNIPEEYQKRSLFIKDVPDNIIEVHEPFEFIS